MENANSVQFRRLGDQEGAIQQSHHHPADDHMNDCKRYFKVVAPLIFVFVAVMLAISLVTLLFIKNDKGKDSDSSSGELPKILHQFSSVDFTNYCGNSYTVENNVITGLKAYKNKLYVTVPRWKRGVPSTLNVVAQTGDIDPLTSHRKSTPTVRSASTNESIVCMSILRAGVVAVYATRSGDPSALQYVQSMEIDPRGWMWIIDVGRLYIATPTPDNSSPPKIIIYDLNTNQTVKSYVFPNEVAPYNSSFLNDIVVDVDRNWAYISGVSTRINPSLAFIIDSVNYGTQNFTTPSDGIALTPDGNELYYCALHSLDLFVVPTSALMNFSLTWQQISQEVVKVIEKDSPSDGLAMTSNGDLIYGGLTTSAVYRINRISSMQPPVSADAEMACAILFRLVTAAEAYSNSVTMQWVDTFAFDDEEGSILWTTNQLFRYFTTPTNFVSSANNNYRIPMRIFSWKTGDRSYMFGK
eukprot:jgi/Bigna1/137628/aug1.40_g12336